MFKRFIRMDDAAAQDKFLRFTASTSDAVDMGGWREVLAHDPADVDVSTARALLLNHDPNRIIGTIRACSFSQDKRTCDMEAELLDGATLETGVSISDAIKSGALRGISVGYAYDRADTAWSSETRTLTVRKWRLLEASATPIPADKSASMRSVPFNLDPNTAHVAEPKEPHMTPEEIKAAAELAAVQAKLARAETENRVRSLAAAHGVSADGLDFGKPEADLNAELLKRHAKANEAKPAEPVTKVVVVADAADKFIEGATKGLVGERGGLVLSASDLVRRCAKFDGEDASDWSPMELANYAMRRMSYSKRDAANKTTASFSVLTGNTANKALLKGFDSYMPVWDKICTIKDAANFNAHYHVGVATGRLTETAEDIAFPELTQREGSYSSTLKMWGATVSVTEQAIVNDELGEIMRSFQRAGYAAARTIDRQVFYVLLKATWTNDVQTGATLATAGNLDLVRAKLKGKLSPAGEKMELEPSILLVDSANAYNAALATGQIHKINETVAGGSPKVTGIQVIDSTWIGDTGLLDGALTSDYYLFGNPNVVDTICLEFLRGMRSPEIQPFDAGAVAAAKYKIKLPFQATVATHTDSAGSARVSGITKATVA